MAGKKQSKATRGPLVSVSKAELEKMPRSQQRLYADRGFVAGTAPAAAGTGTDSE